MDSAKENNSASSEKEVQKTSPEKEAQKTSPIPRIFGFTLLTALSIELTKLCLSPVYGSSPSIPYYFNWEINVLAVVFITNSEASPALQSRLTYFAPVIGCAILPILGQSFQFSDQFGPSWGPLLTSLVTVLPLLYVSMLQVLQDNLTLARQTPDLLSLLGPFPNVPLLLATWGTFYGFRRVVAIALQFSISHLGTPLFTRFGLQVLLSSVFATWAWNRKQYWAISLTLIGICSLHVPAFWNDARLHSVLEREGYALVARQESVTGYISVLENVKDGFRVMRCDHSLLGGIWTEQEIGSKLKEPVYAIFVMLEAVRLVQSTMSPPKADVDKKALIMYVSRLSEIPCLIDK